MNTFKFIGQIKKIEDKKNDDKDRKAIGSMTFDSGWILERAKFRVQCGDSAMFVDASGGKYKDDSKNTVYTSFTKVTPDKGNTFENAQVKWNERFNPEIEKVPNFKKYTIDLASDKYRKKLEEEGKKMELAAALEQKYVYISSYDFTLKLGELLNQGAFGDDIYVVTGRVEYNFSLKDGEGKYYRTFSVDNIYKASEEDAVGAFGKIDLYYY